MQSVQHEAVPGCELCAATQAQLIVSSANWRVILVDDVNYPGFCRVIWNQHVKEMTDLSEAERQEIMQVVWQVEAAQREVLQPHKINLASFGNMVPHLHWHVIPRYLDDTHFPNPVWAAAQTSGPAEEILSARRERLPQLIRAIQQRLSSI
ncbi:HIT family protein [Undibacterium curvum]|uniref:HIT family protein n=1 Tax=Undibacterium curvum TaxID=2762294 RepID=A0ABR7A892_9BURK|nr:HIT family protein [Undibacterium curvum]MBC3933128.1 HIT family protein [Undibacterium curvum]